MLLIVCLAGLAGAVVFCVLIIIMALTGKSVKFPAIGLGACGLVVVAVAVLVVLGIGGPENGTANGSVPPAKQSEAGEADPAGSESLAGEEGSTPAGKEEISEQILLDEQGIVITAKRLDKDGLFGANLKVLIENKSERSLTIQVRDSSVNGYMVDTIFSSDVAAGKRANDEITFVSTDLEACGIKTIADMELSFHIFDDNWETILDSEPVKINTFAAEGYNYSFDDSGEQLHNEGGVRIVSKGFSDDNSIFGPGLVLFIENTTGRDVTVQVRDVSVNGFMVDTIFSEDVTANKHSVTAITIMNSSLRENGIEKIEEMEFYFHVFDTHGWETIFDTGKITITA